MGAELRRAAHRGGQGEGRGGYGEAERGGVNERSLLLALVLVLAASFGAFVAFEVVARLLSGLTW